MSPLSATLTSGTSETQLSKVNSFVTERPATLRDTTRRGGQGLSLNLKISETYRPTRVSIKNNAAHPAWRETLLFV